MQHANQEVFLVLQIEDREAVERIEDIAAVPSFDLLFVGPADLSISYGVPMQFDHPVLQDAIEHVARAALKHGKWWGMSTGSPAAAQAAVDRGARMITAGGDHPFLVRGFQQAFEDFSAVRIR
jgi:2-keto-3-deoxy-L-rhamnonate aldolase RhmA